MHYFGEDGARKTGTNTIAFSDDNYSINTSSSGDKGSGVFAKKYYSLGVVLKANGDIRYGIYNQKLSTLSATDDTTNERAGYAFGPQGVSSESTTDGKLNTNTKLYDTKYAKNLYYGNYLVLTTSGSKQKGAKTAKKDSDGNYWVVDSTDGYLRGIWSVNVKYQSANFETKQFKAVNNTYTDDNDYAASDFADDLTIYDSQAGDFPASTTFTAVAKDNDGTYWTMKTKSKFDGYWYQSDYGDKSNVWIPFGVYDNAGKTCTMNVNKEGSVAMHGYEVTPNSDYFLNCYWN